MNIKPTAILVLFTIASFTFAGEDWPMWRGNASRSAAINNALPAEFNVQWTRHYASRQQAWDDPLNLDLMTYDRVFEPIVYDGLLCVGFNDQDKLVALDAATGEQRWTFYAEGPVRLPPVGHAGKIYFCSDDSYLYCLNANDGSLHWKFRGAPNAQHAIGNRRLISAWPARGGPVVYDDTVYFAASIWPFMGTFIYALDAESGDVQWRNDNTGAQYIKQPHSAPSFAGVAPQGAMVATEDWLIVPGGRSVPAVFDRLTGKLKYFEINAGGKGTGGSFVTADEFHYYVHTREKGTRAFNLKTGIKTAFTPNEPVIANGILYSAETANDNALIRAYEVANDDNTSREPIWEVKAAGRDELILAGNTLLAAAGRMVTLIELPESNGMPEVLETLEVTSLRKDEKIVRLLVATEKLFVVGDQGTITALGDRSIMTEAQAHKYDEPKDANPQLARSILDLVPAEGYAFWFGRADSPGLLALTELSPFKQLAVVDQDERRIHRLRQRLDKRGLLGRVTAHVSKPQAFRAPEYVAHSVFVTSEVAASDASMSAVYKSVRPYGGRLVVIDESGTELNQAALRRIENLKLEQAKCELVDIASDRRALVVERVGALPGSADWTHQYGDVANTIKSDDQRVKLPLGILWFGGSSNMDVLPRHGHGPPEQVVGGRLFIQGMNSMSARDVYTGRVLWKREFENLGTFDVYYDSTYEDKPLDPKYNQVHIPGANGRGTNYVATEDRIYLLIGATCLMLDPATGKDVGKIELPMNQDGSQSEWGYLGIYDDVLLGGLGFANYRDRHKLEFESDKQLSGNRAGYGSKSLDRAASRGLIAFDRHSGKQLWRLDAKHSFWHNGIVAGGGRVYCLDKNPTQIEEAMRRRGLSLPDSYRIVCVDVNSGDVQWEVKEGIFGTWLGYSAKHNLLLQAGAKASDRLYAEVGQGMRVYHADTGELHWKKDGLRYAGPCILHNDLIITNANSYSESAGAFYLIDGKQKMVKHPLTGKEIPWTMTRAYGCNNIIASENMLTFRSGAAGYYDLTTDSGTGNLGGFKSGCTANLVVANGVLNAPDYTRTCSCSYQNQTSLALVHMPDVEVWSVNALAALAEVASDPEESLVESVGFNLGAAGDRRDDAGVLWLEYPVKAGGSPPFQVEYNSDANVFAQHSSTRGDDPRAWISSSGLDNVKELTLLLNLTEPIDLAKGIGIAHAADDAEESETGDVSLSSSDLELAQDGGNQTIGLRFASVPLPKSAKIQAAYIQFTCDEPSSETASLWIAGERSPNAQRYATATHDVSVRTKTKSEVTWSPPPWKKIGDAIEAQRTPDLSRILNEIISQDKWESGNSMAFVIGGEGQRTAVSSQRGNKDAARLIVIADTTEDKTEDTKPKNAYEVELVFASPRGSSEARIFDVYAQEKLVKKNMEVRPSSKLQIQPAAQLTLPNVEIGERLHLKFVARQGKPVLCGVRIKRNRKLDPR